jgi:hypothetical protein
MKILLLVLTSIVLIATLAPLARTGMWWVRALDFLRLQTACVGLATAVLIVAFFGGNRTMLWLLPLSLGTRRLVDRTAPGVTAKVPLFRPTPTRGLLRHKPPFTRTHLAGVRQIPSGRDHPLDSRGAATQIRLVF